MKRALLTAFLMATASPGLADERSDCLNDDTAVPARIAACETVLDRDGKSADTLNSFGEALLDADRAQEAVAALSESLLLDPDNAYTLQRRSVALNILERDAEAEADLERATALAPEVDFNFYRLGLTRNNLRKFEAAELALATAIEMDPDYYWSRAEMGRTLKNLGRQAEAGESFAVASRLRPFSSAVQFQAFWAFLNAGLDDRAAYFARLLYTMDPNRLTIRDWLETYVAGVPAEDLAPFAWTVPDPETELRFFQVLAPVDQREDMEKAIGDLAVWFGTNMYPIPESAVMYREKLVLDPAGDPDQLFPVREVEDRNSPAQRPAVESGKLPYFRSLFPLYVQPLGPSTPFIGPRWGDTTPKDIWPLQDGKTAEGQADYIVKCDTGTARMPRILMGCVVGVESVDVGTFDWTAGVTREQIHVPLGVFTAYKVSISLRGQITLIGKSNPVQFDAAYWVVPDLNRWVAAIFTIGDKFSYAQATEIVSR